MWKRGEGHLELQAYLVALYEPFYKTNDKAHQIPHVVSVADCAVDINTDGDFELDNEILVAAAITHDLFNHSRDNHHEMIKDYLLNNPIPWLQEFTPMDRYVMAHAAGEHRASYKGNYTTIYSEIVASADRGAPNVKSAIIRCAVFGVDKCGFAGEALYTHVASHMKDKFGLAGYARFPNVYMQYFGKELSSFQETMEDLTKEQIDMHIGNHPVSQSFK